MNMWAIILIVGVGTYLLRLSFFVLFAGRELSPVAQRALRLVPPAVFSALIASALLVRTEAGGVALDIERWLAGAVALIVAWATRSVLATIGGGMIALWLLQALLG